MFADTVAWAEVLERVKVGLTVRETLLNEDVVIDMVTADDCDVDVIADDCEVEVKFAECVLDSLAVVVVADI